MGEDTERQRGASGMADDSTEAQRPVRIAELPPMSPTRSPSRSPEFAEWDAYTPRKPYGVLRNDRTPLNTPYTPQLVKLHMKRHDEYENQADADRAEGLLTRVAASVRAKMAVLARPVRKIRTVVDNTVTWLVPRCVQQASVFARVRPWVVSYLTAVICVPIVWLCSPMVIALTIFTSPVWCAGLAALAIRQLVPANSHSHLSEYAHSSDLSTTTDDDHDELSPPYLSSAYRQADFNGSRLGG